MNNYFELRIEINPDIEDIVSDICFSNFDCEGVVMAEEAYKDLVMTSTTRGTLRVFLRDLKNNPLELLQTERELLKERGLTDEELGSWKITLDEKENQDCRSTSRVGREALVSGCIGRSVSRYVGCAF